MVTKKTKGLGRGLESLLGPQVLERVEAALLPGDDGLPHTLALSEMVAGR